MTKDKPPPPDTMAKDNKGAKKKNKPLAMLTIPAADGYHYGDDCQYGDNPENEWDKQKQTRLVDALKAAETHLLGILAQAARQYQRALEIRKRISDQVGMATTYSQLGTLLTLAADSTDLADRITSLLDQVDKTDGAEASPGDCQR